MFVLFFIHVSFCFLFMFCSSLFIHVCFFLIHSCLFVLKIIGLDDLVAFVSTNVSGFYKILKKHDSWTGKVEINMNEIE